MIFKIKTQEDLVLATIEVGLEHLRKTPNVEIRSHIDIENYTTFFLEHLDTEKSIDIMKAFKEISNLREWMWDDFMANKHNVAKYLDPVVKHVRDLLLATAYEFNLILE